MRLWAEEQLSFSNLAKLRQPPQQQNAIAFFGIAVDRLEHSHGRLIIPLEPILRASQALSLRGSQSGQQAVRDDFSGLHEVLLSLWNDSIISAGGETNIRNSEGSSGGQRWLTFSYCTV